MVCVLVLNEITLFQLIYGYTSYIYDTTGILCYTTGGWKPEPLLLVKIEFK